MSGQLGDEERAELIGAVTNAVLVADGLLEACRPHQGLRMADAAKRNGSIADARAHLDHWRADLDKLKQRLASVTIEPPARPQ